ncbi:MAG: hypothetical protein RI935_105 [Candidatus Parcubacteria bacterium]|jgi:large subunit ribosomal protein L21
MSIAIVQTGSKQYKVSQGDIITVEKLTGDYKVGDTVELKDVVLTDDGTSTTVGAPFVKGAAVKATIKEIGKGDKIMIVRYRAKSRYHKRNGHRQPFMKLEIGAVK